MTIKHNVDISDLPLPIHLPDACQSGHRLGGAMDLTAIGWDQHPVLWRDDRVPTRQACPQ